MRGMKNQLVKVARVLRKNQTPQEIKLWRLLRDRRFKNFKFRRQHPVGPYVVDFYCEKGGVVVELDGGIHNERNQRQNDIVRDRYLKSEGDRVVRFWNNDIDNNIDGVCQQIERLLNH